ncbi:heme ABC transporter ATP-binding protein [Gynurincola endophyticus]|uniref:heme ABC transporter ATP-binding protein n=1 Tax=Gynurincola endophyticus TaxID=2479004 RepID=UPI000F8EA785|nr:heme ABC transporter ATP-binding protein [Gynurincola endophyticus]
MNIVAQNIHFSVGKKSILKGVNFTAKAGKVLGILGQNGAGKSTLLNCLAGALKGYTGKIAINNMDIDRMQIQQLAKQRAVLSQNHSITQLFKCSDIVMMGRYPHFSTSPSKFDMEVVERAMYEMQVNKLADRYYVQLSGGEQQRVQMARVIAQLQNNHSDNSTQKKTGVLLLDEPISNMDILFQHHSMKMARKLAKDGLTVIVILHDLNLAAQYCDELLLMHGGEVVEQGEIEQVLTPDNIYTAYGINIKVLKTVEHPYPIMVPVMNEYTTQSIKI